MEWLVCTASLRLAIHLTWNCLTLYYALLLLAWESELGTPFSEQDWLKFFLLTHKLPLAFFAQEKNYKILTRWYCYPTLLRRIYPSTSDYWWGCNTAPGTMLHVKWDCPMLLSFWENIIIFRLTISQALMFPHLPKQASYLCFRDWSRPLKKGTSNIFWRPPRQSFRDIGRLPGPPSLAEWASEINLLMRMESLMADDSGWTIIYERTWSVWFIFQGGPTFASWLATGSLNWVL